MNDKRHFSRITLDGRAVLVDEQGHRWESSLADISLRGALIALPDGWSGKRDDPIQLELLPDDSDSLIIMRGCVAHVSGSQLGVHCESIDLDSVSHLRRLIELNLGDESLLQRELAELVAG